MKGRKPMSLNRDSLKDKKRVVIKIGSSSLIHPETGRLNLTRMEKLVRILVDLRNEGKDVCLVSSGAIAAGRVSAGLKTRPDTLPVKQACAAVGQANLIMVYQKLFSEYGTNIGQVLLTRITMEHEVMRNNSHNTFEELFSMGVIPIVNENDSISTEEIEQVSTFGDNDRLSAMVLELIQADLLILMSDIDGMYTDDPKQNPDAELITEVVDISTDLRHMAKDTAVAGFGTGGMSAKLTAADIVMRNGKSMLIINGNNPENIRRAIDGEEIGTLFIGNK